MCARYYENPTMLSKVTAKNVGDVFLRHTVETQVLAKCNKTKTTFSCLMHVI